MPKQAAAMLAHTTVAASDAASYDFQRPPRLSPSQVRVLGRLHEQVAAQWEAVLSSAAQCPVQVRALAAAEDDGSRLFAEPLAAVTFTISPHGGRGGLCFDPSLAFALVECSLGGKPNGQAPNRLPTELELSLLRRIAERLLPEYSRTWRRLAEAELRIGDTRTGSALAGLVGHAGVCIAPFQVTLGSLTAELSVCLPMPEADCLLSHLSLQAWISGRHSADGQPVVLDLLQESRVPVRAVLGSLTVSLADLLTLQPGDVVCLPGMSDQAVTLCVADQPKFFGKPCQQHGSLVIQLHTAFASEEVPSS